MTQDQVVAAIGLALLLVGQIGAVAYWGGGIRAELRNVASDVRGLRMWKHDTLVPWTTDVESRMGVAEERLTEHDRRFSGAEERLTEHDRRFSDNERGAHA